MSASKRLHLGLLMEATGKHVASWLDPATQVDSADDIEHYVRMARLAEQGKLDFVFASDSPGIPVEDPALLSRRALFMTRFEPVTLLSALAMATSRIGVAGTVSTSFSEPYNIARQFASLDHISHGRGAWNVVTTASDYSARNFGLDSLPDHADRYDRAREYLEVVKALWDTYEGDAFVRDRARALYFDPAKFHPVEHVGPHFSVRGALNSARTPQGRPVLIQAGASGDGRNLAAAHADLIFASAIDLASATDFYRDIKARIAAVGRDPDDVKVLPGLTLVLGSSRQEAEDRFQELQSRVHPDIVRHTLAADLEIDLRGHDLDTPIAFNSLPAVGNRHKAFFEQLRGIVAAERPTLRQLFERWNSRAFRGTPIELADRMEEWLGAGAADGFMVSFESMTTGLGDFVGQVVPELQRRGLFRTEYEGTTLRDSLNIPVPPNRHTL